MCEDHTAKGRVQPPMSLLLWFVGITAFMVAIARWA